MSSPAVLVPVKQPEQSKNRLQPILAEEHRSELVRCLTRDCLESLSNLDPSIPTGLITASPEIKELTRSHGLAVVDEPSQTETLGEVVDQASAVFAEEHEFEGLLVFPVDLPWLTVDGIQSLLEEASDNKVLLVPDAARQGTNALWRNPMDCIECQYEGTASFEQHCTVSRRQGIEPTILERDEFSFDLDSPEDWYRMLEDPNKLGEHTRSFVEIMLIDLPSMTGGGS